MIHYMATCIIVCGSIKEIALVYSTHACHCKNNIVSICLLQLDDYSYYTSFMNAVLEKDSCSELILE